MSDMPKLKISETFFYPVGEKDGCHSNLNDSETILALPTQETDSTVQSMLERFFEPETITEYKPPGYGSADPPPETIKTATISEAPEKLAIQIKRFRMDDYGRSTRMDNIFTDATDSIKIVAEFGKTHIYQPKGIIVHIPGGDATNADSGHYVYYEKISGNQWREINDEKATDFDITKDSSRNESIQKNCYLVTYEKHV